MHATDVGRETKGCRSRLGSRRRSACLLATGSLGAAIGLVACGLFTTPAGLPTLYVGDVQASGNNGYVLVSIVAMPAGGLAAVQFGEMGSEAIALNDIDPASVEVEGQNGFVILAEAFRVSGGAVIAANGSDGVMSGDILRFTFTVTGDNPTFAVTKASVRLVSSDDEFLATWVLKTAADAVYIAR